jgi:hypothetical protein
MLCLHQFLKILQELYSFIENLFYLIMTWSSVGTYSIIVSGDARLAANDWPCVVSWLCVTLFDINELFVCRYDP